MKKKYVLILVSFVSLCICSCTAYQRLTKTENPGETSLGPKNIIFMIVDGMGFEFVRALKIYKGNKPPAFEQFECSSQVTTCAYEGADKDKVCIVGSEHVTDSAASATAIATGEKVKNGVVSLSTHSDNHDIKTILEMAKDMKKSTGVVATKLFSDATPAAFTSHAKSRKDTEKILEDMFMKSAPNVIFGADNDMHRKAAKNSKYPYQMIYTKDDLKTLAHKIYSRKGCAGENCPHVYGGFGEHELIPDAFNMTFGLPFEVKGEEYFKKHAIPHLHEMADAALKILSKNDKGFFLMVESSLPDIVGHFNSHIDANEKSPSAIEVLVSEMKEVEKTAKILEKFVRENPDTLLVLTADHETGGLVLEADKTECMGKKNCVPKAHWTSGQYDKASNSAHIHTNKDVPLYATGKGAKYFCQEKMNNTDIIGLSLKN